jgi:hypothetical protein
MYELAFPSAVSNEFGFDLFQRSREFRPQKIVADSSDRFLFPPAIELLGTVVPKVNYALHGASHDAVVYQLKNSLMRLQRRHSLLQYVLSLARHAQIFHRNPDRSLRKQMFKARYSDHASEQS